MKALVALGIVAALAAGLWLAAGVAALRPVLAVGLPYLAMAVFLVGMVARVVRWGRSPVPFRIPTVAGQQRSLPFLRHDPLDSPYTGWQAAARVALEALLFRSLFRNTRAAFTRDRRLVDLPSKWLWLGALAFHWSFLVVLIRHLRFFMEPVPRAVLLLERLDGLFQVAVPALLVTDVVIAAALLYLLGRRLLDARLRYISLPADYVPLFLLLGIVGSGILMRYVDKVDLVAVKELALGLVTLSPVVPEGLGVPFVVHLGLVSALFLYFPFSKLVHMGGVFLSPTRNLANDSRARRHVNPWNRPVEVHTYEQWEEEFRDKLRAAGLPVEGE